MCPQASCPHSLSNQTASCPTLASRLLHLLVSLPSRRQRAEAELLHDRPQPISFCPGGTDRRMEGWTEGWMEGQKDAGRDRWRIDGRTDGWKDGGIDRRRKGLKDKGIGWTDGMENKQAGGWMDRWRDNRLVSARSSTNTVRWTEETSRWGTDGG